MSRIDTVRLLASAGPKLAAVEEELRHALDSKLPAISKLESHLRAGQGKRLRPALMLTAARFCGYQGDADVRFGAVFEMIHTATLVHDDVIDHAATRRSKPTLNALWGNPLTVLFGDRLYIQALGSAMRDRSWPMMDLLFGMTSRMIEGELIQNECLFHLETSRKDYFEILERKTALLFGGCTRGAALLAGRSAEEQDALERYGLEIGKAFQLVDDLLDYTSTPEELGKPVFSDLREGKLTLPMLSLLERAPETAKALVERIWKDSEGGAHLAPGLEQELRAMLERYGAYDETRRLAREASANAVAQIRDLDGDPGAKALLMEAPEMLLNRSR